MPLSAGCATVSTGPAGRPPPGGEALMGRIVPFADLSYRSAAPGNRRGRVGFSTGRPAAARATTGVHDIPAEKKRRIYFVGHGAAHSERAHAMIVEYVRDTVTGLHMHPNAESMFVLLSGRTRFTVNGEDVIVGRGQATVFPMGDRHGLRVAEGDGVSFLEFHIPAGYTTVRG